MKFKNLKISPFISVFGIVILFILLSGLVMSLGFLFPDSDFVYIIGLIGVCLFVLATYFINNWYFNKINLIPPTKIQLNKTLLIKIGIGFSLALIINYSSRLYWSIYTESMSYLIIAFSLENFVKAIFSGITEEIVFRGTLLNFFNQKNKKYLGLIITSVLFGFIHLSNSLIGEDVSVLQIAYFICMGILFGLIYLNFGLVSSITCHFLGNLMVSGFTHHFNNNLYYILGIVIILNLILFIREIKKKGTSKKY